MLSSKCKIIHVLKDNNNASLFLDSAKFTLGDSDLLIQEITLKKLPKTVNIFLMEPFDIWTI
jgi:hypothetical protein